MILFSLEVRGGAWPKVGLLGSRGLWLLAKSVTTFFGNYIPTPPFQPLPSHAQSWQG